MIKWLLVNDLTERDQLDSMRETGGRREETRSHIVFLPPPHASRHFIGRISQGNLGAFWYKATSIVYQSRDATC